MNLKTLLTALAGVFVLAPAANAAAPYSYAIGDKISSDGVDYVIKSENLFINGNFENGFENWLNGRDQEPTAQYWAIADNGGPDDGKYLHTVAKTNESSSNSSGLRCYFEMTPGKTYYFFAYAKNGGSNMRLCTNKSKSTSGIKDHVCDFTSGAEWTKDEAVIDVTTENCWGVIQCGWFGSKEFALGDVSLYEVEAEAVEPVVMNPDTYYKIYNESANTYLSASTGLTMQEEDAEGYDQIFSLVATGTKDVYNLATSAGNFFTKSSSNQWTTTVVASPDLASTSSQVKIELSGATMTIKCLASKYFGSNDNASAGSTVYCDKDGSAVIKFKVTEVTGMPAPVLGDSYNQTVEKINTVLANATYGDDFGQYPEGSDAALRAALEEYSPSAMGEYKTQGSVNAVIVTIVQGLENALAAFEAQKKIAVPVSVGEVKADTYYQLYNATANTYLSAKDGWLTMQEKGAAGYDQIFSLVETGTKDVYNLATSTGEFYTIGSSPWDSTVKPAPNLDSTKAQVSLVIGGETMTLKALGNAGSHFLGSDNNSAANTAVYANKGADRAIPFSVNLVVVAPATDLEAFNAVKVDATDALDKAVYGDAVGEYPAEAGEALQAALDMYSNGEVQTQGTANAAVIRLNAALDAFNNAQKIGPVTIKPSKYTIRIYNSEGGLYTGWVDDKHIGVFLLPGTGGTAYRGEFDVEKVEGTDDVFTLKNDGGYIANSSNALVVSSTVSSAAYFTFETNTTYYLIRSQATGKYLGTQWGSFFNWAHGATDLNADAPGAHFVLTDLSETVGVEAVAAESEAPVEYFNLQGVRVANPENGLYIRRQGDKVSKVFVR